MAEIVNLRRVKKSLAREAEAVRAAGNRAKHGRTAQERETDAKRRAIDDRALDGARLSRDGEALE